MNSKRKKLVLFCAVLAVASSSILFFMHKKKMENFDRLSYVLSLKKEEIKEVEIESMDVENWTSYHVSCVFKISFSEKNLLKGREWTKINDDVYEVSNKDFFVRLEKIGRDKYLVGYATP